MTVFTVKEGYCLKFRIIPNKAVCAMLGGAIRYLSHLLVNKSIIKVLQ